MGGRGAKIVIGTNAGGGGSKNGSADDRELAARVNRLYKGNKQSIDNMRMNFRNEVINDNIEHMIAVDSDGFAHVMRRGDSGSVGIRNEEVAGKFVFHNHPDRANGDSGGTFSRADLAVTAENDSLGIGASERKGDWIFAKTKNFKPKEFVKGLQKSPVTNTVIVVGNETSKQAYERTQRQTMNWLRANQKRYGYKFTFKEDKTLGAGAVPQSELINRRNKKGKVI